MDQVVSIFCFTLLFPGFPTDAASGMTTVPLHLRNSSLYSGYHSSVDLFLHARRKRVSSGFFFFCILPCPASCVFPLLPPSVLWVGFTVLSLSLQDPPVRIRLPTFPTPRAPPHGVTQTTLLCSVLSFVNVSPQPFLSDLNGTISSRPVLTPPSRLVSVCCEGSVLGSGDLAWGTLLMVTLQFFRHYITPPSPPSGPALRNGFFSFILEAFFVVTLSPTRSVRSAGCLLACAPPLPSWTWGKDVDYVPDPKTCSSPLQS